MTTFTAFYLSIAISCVGYVVHGDLSMDDLSGKRLSDVLTDIADKITGVSYVQKKFNELKYRREPFKGGAYVDELANILDRKFKTRIQTVENLRRVIEDEYDNFTDMRSPDDVLCCKPEYYSPVEQPIFSTKVDLDRLCVHEAGTVVKRDISRKYITDKVIKAMKENYEKHRELKWQYFAAEDGLYFNWPAVNFDPKCNVYDHRFRPFYVEAATPTPKDIVIVVDESESMRNNKLDPHNDLARLAVGTAKTILETLNPRDKVGIVTFSSNTRTPYSENNDCYSRMLAEATPQNVKVLKEWISRYQSNGGTQYIPAINKAFDLLENSNSANGTRDKVILFLTDGEPNEGEEKIMQAIRQRNARMSNSVILMTYLLGTNHDSKAIRILKNMAEQTTFDSRYGNVTKGTYTYIADPKRLRSEMASYYNFFSRRHLSKKPVITIPYVDAFSKNLITSILLPVYAKNVFIGVVGTDINISDLLEDITYFKRGETAYAFLIDSKGRLMTHPLLPIPHNVEEPPVFVHAADIEYTAAKWGVIKSMMSGKSGNATFSSRHILARGSRSEGVNGFKLISHYYWHWLDYANSSLCIVISEKDTRAMLEDATLPSSRQFVYHDFPLQNTSDSTCKYFNSTSIQGSSVVKFSPFAFRQPLLYLYRDETKKDIEEYGNYMKGEIDNPGFKPYVRPAVAATANAEEFWMQRTLSNDSKSIVWQKFGTFDGVLRLYPGKVLPKSYDHTQTPWFQRTVGLRSPHVIAAPRVDVWGTGNVVTTANIIFHGKPDESYSHDDRIAGVIATDFTVPFLYTKMLESNDACSLHDHRCFIMDSSGFIVMHVDLVNDDVQQKKLEPVHIIKKLPWIAKHLISKGIMLRQGCIDYQNIRIFNTWTAFVDGRYRHTNKAGNVDFILERVGHTNTILGIYNVNAVENTSCHCSSEECGPSAIPNPCECPCYEQVMNGYEYCLNRFYPSSDSQLTCSPRIEGFTYGPVDDTSTDGLDRCIDNQCEQMTDKGQCYVLTGCLWCEGTNDTTPMCGYYDDHCNYPQGGLSDVVLGLIIGASVLVVAIVIGITIFLCLRRRRRLPTRLRDRPVVPPLVLAGSRKASMTKPTRASTISTATSRTTLNSSLAELSNSVQSEYITTIQDEDMVVPDPPPSRVANVNGARNPKRQIQRFYSNQDIRPPQVPKTSRSLSVIDTYSPEWLNRKHAADEHIDNAVQLPIQLTSEQGSNEVYQEIPEDSFYLCLV